MRNGLNSHLQTVTAFSDCFTVYWQQVFMLKCCTALPCYAGAVHGSDVCEWVFGLRSCVGWTRRNEVQAFAWTDTEITNPHFKNAAGVLRSSVFTSAAMLQFKLFFLLKNNVNSSQVYSELQMVGLVSSSWLIVENNGLKFAAYSG